MNKCYPRTMSHTPPNPTDLPALRPAVAEYRRARLNGDSLGLATHRALWAYQRIRPDEDAHTARAKVAAAVAWAKQEFPEWMKGG